MGQSQGASAGLDSRASRHEQTDCMPVPPPGVLAQVLEAIPSGVLITDARQPDNPICYANPGFLAVTGYAPEEILGQNCRFLQGPARDPVAGELRRSIESATSMRTVLLNYRKDGSAFWNELTIKPLFDERGQVSHFVGFQDDVSQRVAAERQRDQLKAALLESVASSARAGRGQTQREVSDVLAGCADLLRRLGRELTDARTQGIASAATCLQNAEHDLASYLEHDPRGQLIPEFLAIAAARFEHKREAMLAEVERLSKRLAELERRLSDHAAGPAWPDAAPAQS